MKFQLPLLLAAVSGVLIPLIVHLIGRRRAQRVPFAALDYVLQSDRRISRRLRLRHLALLLIRMAIIAALAVMMAKPFVETDSDLPALAAEPTSVVLIIDDTASMRRQVGGQSVFSLAKQRALEVVDGLSSGAEIALLTVADPSGPIPAFTRNARSVRRAIALLEPTFRHARVDRALAEARALRGRAIHTRAHTLLISDLAAHGLSKRTFGQVYWVDAAGTGPRDNRAIVEIVDQPSAAGGERATVIGVRVCNYGRRASKERVALWIEQRQLAAGQLELAPSACDVKRFEHVFARGGVYETRATIDPDAYSIDDVFYHRLEVRNAIRVLLVNGSPSTIPHRDELFYLRAALNTEGASRRIATQVTSEQRLDQLTPSAFDVVALVNTGHLSRTGANKLLQFVKAGGGLLIAVGDQVRAENANALLGELLPQPLRGVNVALERPLRIGHVDGTHPILTSIWSKEGGGLASVRVRRAFHLQPVSGSERRHLISYDDGTPALVERRIGSGRALMLTTTVDRDWTDLPIRPGYLPLMREIIGYLSNTARRRSPSTLVSGSRQQLTFPEGAQQLRVLVPGGGQRVLTLSKRRQSRTAEMRVERPGFYRVFYVTDHGDVRVSHRGGFVVNVDPRESDLRRGSLGETKIVADQQNRRAKRPVELWSWVGALLLLLVLGESVIGRRS